MNNIFYYDERLLLWLQRHVLNFLFADQIFTFLAVWPVYLLPLILIAGWFYSEKSKKDTIKVALASFFSWFVLNKAIAAIVNRPRPSASLLEAKELVFHRPDTSFPSDHTAVLVAASLMVKMLGYDKIGNVMLVLTALVVISRVFVGVHFPLDIIGGAVVGTIGCLTIYKFREQIDIYVSQPIIRAFKKIGL
jgi:undecaprenyl-diphosphatase